MPLRLPFLVALGLTLSTVLPGAATPAAATPGSQPATRPAGSALEPYTALALNFPGPLPNVKGMYPVTLAGPQSTNPGIAAKEITRLAPGLRVVLAGDVAQGILDHPDDVCMTANGQPTTLQGVWPNAGPLAAAQRFDTWLKQFAAAGGSIDLLVVSAEEDLAIWNMAEDRLTAITEDPRFPKVAKALGFADARQAMLQRSPKAGEPARWNALMSGVVSAARRKAVLEPLHRYFPAAAMCNFNDLRIDEAHVAMGVLGQPWYTVGGPAGTHQSPALFGGAAPPQIEADWSRPYVQMIFAVNFVRCVSRSSNVPQIPWVPFKGLTVGGGFGGGDMYEEAVTHIMLSGGTTNVFFFNPLQPKEIPPGAKVPRFSTPADAEALNSLMREVRREAGGKRIVAPVSVDPVRYDARFVVSAARLEDGSTLCRITFAETEGTAQIRVGGEVVKVDRPLGRTGVWMRIP
ncbi:hypothetical protein [Humisphaera borealis]|uniref:Glycoside hydrolase family 42 N-terminal domain-containing protein n=1 Tax=Humisphaera borealis TaxID=2807512 RepID=A0A7M2WTW3_9BACT|nr:hypothetical protein [Humisphaera borealis]QOV88965.1 hypothetical protein IPV69_22490 [Humisphaera borealis]